MSAQKTIRIGLLGFGSMGKTHAYAVTNLNYFYRDLPFRAEIVGVCTTSMEKSRAVCEEYGFSLATDREDEFLSSTEIDVIDICTPNNCHFSTLRAAIMAGKHIYCEKPLCISQEQAEEIASLAKQRGNGQIHNIVFNNRFLAPILRAKQLVDEGRIALTPAVELSYLREEEQEDLLETMESEDCTPSLSQAMNLKAASQARELNMDRIFDIMTQQIKQNEALNRELRQSIVEMNEIEEK